MELFKQLFKNLLLRNRQSDFEVISLERSFGDPYQKVFWKFDPTRNMAMENGGYLHNTDMKKFLKFYFLKLLVRF